MDRKIIPFRTPAVDPALALERALLLAEAEEGWSTTTVPQAVPAQNRAVY